MGAIPLSENRMREAKEAFSRIGTDFANQHDAAEASGFNSRGAFMNAVRRFDDWQRQNNGETMAGFEIVKQSETRDADGNIRSTSITQKPEAGDQFQIPDGHKIKGLSTLTNAQGEVVSQWTKTTAGELDPIELAGLIAESISEYTYKPINVVPPSKVERDLATTYLMADWHVGLLSWKPETGENWDVGIAKDKIMTAVSRCVQSSPASEQGVILGLGDLMHFDGYEPVTSRSRNILDADGRYPKVLRAATEMMAQSVALALERHDQVLVRILPGNHDDQSAIAVSLALSLKYADNARVDVDDSPSRFWWWRWGKVLLGATHGDKTKMKDLPLVMAADCPEDWAASNYRKVFTGHIHHESKVEEGGVIVESMRAPVAKDAYHAGARYRAGRSISSETFAKDGSKVSRVSINL